MEALRISCSQLTVLRDPEQNLYFSDSDPLCWIEGVWRLLDCPADSKELEGSLPPLTQQSFQPFGVLPMLPGSEEAVRSYQRGLQELLGFHCERGEKEEKAEKAECLVMRQLTVLFQRLLSRLPFANEYKLLLEARLRLAINSCKRMDALLQADGAGPLLVIEAKRPSCNLLCSKNVAQLKAYLIAACLQWGLPAIAGLLYNGDRAYLFGYSLALQWDWPDSSFECFGQWDLQDAACLRGFFGFWQQALAQNANGSLPTAGQVHMSVSFLSGKDSNLYNLNLKMLAR
jgi:hypothetical protein